MKLEGGAATATPTKRNLQDGIRKNGRREERREVKKRLAVEASPENCFVMQRVYVILLS
jgi:hypothetical protein